MTVGAKCIAPSATRPIFLICSVIADEEIWQECREYAKQLATEADLSVTNAMPAHLLESRTGQASQITRVA